MTTAARSVRRGAVSFHWTTGVLGLAALITQLVLTINGVNVLTDESGELTPIPTRIVRFFSYFTIQSNLLVIVGAISLALRPDRDGRLWRVIRLASLLGITVTFFVYLVALLPLITFGGLALVTDRIFHIIIPILAVVGYLVFGPRPRIDLRTVWWVLLWPAAYIVYTLIHGAYSGWYPYPFTNVTNLGYPLVILNGVLVAALIFAVALVFRWLDRTLAPQP